MNYDVITIGTGTADIFLRSKLFRAQKNKNFASGWAACFAFGSKIEIDEMYFSTGGGGTNCATTFARAGKKTAWIGIVGKDSFGDEIVKAVEKENIDSALIKRVEGQSGYSNILLSPSGERTILVYRGVSDDWGKIKMPWPKIKASWLFVTSLGGDLALLGEILNFAEEHAINIAFNPGLRELLLGWKRLAPLLSRVHLLILNREEAARLAGKPYDNLREIYRRLTGLAQQAVVITEGKRGATACNGSECYKVGIYPLPAVDSTGAGDAFGSGFLAEFMDEGNIEQALRYAAWNSSNVVSKIGAKEGIVRAFPKKLIKVSISKIY
jgi:ribokinase